MIYDCSTPFSSVDHRVVNRYVIWCQKTVVDSEVRLQLLVAGNLEVISGSPAGFNECVSPGYGWS